MKPDRQSAPIEALLVRQCWDVLESGAVFADAQRALARMEAQLADAEQASEAWQAQVARATGQKTALNPALMHWLAAHAERQAAALRAAQIACARALETVGEKGAELARHRRMEELLREELRDIAQEAQGRREARENQEASDRWAQRRRAVEGV